jgi:predicted Zn-dependent protease
MGRDREALAEMRRAQELDPLSLIINGMLAMALSNCGMHEEALEQLRKTSEMDP